MNFISRLLARLPWRRRHLDVLARLFEAEQTIRNHEANLDRHRISLADVVSRIKQLQADANKRDLERPWQELNYQKREELMDAVKKSLETKGPVQLGRGAHVAVEIVYDHPDAGGECKEAGELARSGALDDSPDDVGETVLSALSLEKISRILRRHGEQDAAELLERANQA